MSAFTLIAIGAIIVVASIVMLRKAGQEDATEPPPKPQPPPKRRPQKITPYTRSERSKQAPPAANAQRADQAARREEPSEDWSKKPLTDLDSKATEAWMTKVLTKTKRPIPTWSQWAMILSPSRLTRVIAGAGSGKSSALSLRTVFLHKKLGIPLEQISIITFTRASRADMVSKLIRDMATFGVQITETQAKKIVRTFHSMILSQANNSFTTTYLEQIGGSGSRDDLDDAGDLGFMSPKQLDHLRKVYETTYKNNATFRKSIGAVLLEKISSVRQMQYTDQESLEKAMAVSEPRDLSIVKAITDAWLARENFDKRTDVISWEPVKVKTSKGTWYANGKVLATGMPIVLGQGGIQEAAKNPVNRSKYPLPGNDQDRSLGFMTNVRLKVLATVATERYLYVETEGDLGDLYAYISWAQHKNETGESLAVNTFPAFSVRIPGDTSSASIFEALYTLGSFIATIGRPVASTARELAKEMREQGHPLEANLCQALESFWPQLHKKGYSTYNELFLKLGDREQIKKLPTESLLPMKHLMVDEFQDISGQIIEWIKAVQAELAEREETPSLMVVGDDWQSVYGWRGSDPEYLIKFDNYFGESKLVVMNENFRCGQHIINTAERLVTHLNDSAIQKHGVAAGEAAEALGDVVLIDEGDARINSLVDTIKKESPDASVFIISRTNEGLTPFRRFQKDRKVTLLTMHRAKGLEADYVIIKGDCGYTNTSPLKNAVYRTAGLQKTYDVAQQDEALRLAYVAITRAKKKAIWVCEKPQQDGAFEKLKDSKATESKTNS